jgi:hypothetical protein
VLAEVQIKDPAGQARAAIFAQLQGRLAEIEEGVLTRVSTISGPGEIDDPEYQYGFRAAIPAAIGYGLAALESGDQHPPPVPAALLTQARIAARHAVGLDTVVRRYVSGRDELSRFLIGEVDRAESRVVGLTSLMESL